MLAEAMDPRELVAHGAHHRASRYQSRRSWVVDQEAGRGGRRSSELTVGSKRARRRRGVNASPETAAAVPQSGPVVEAGTAQPSAPEIGPAAGPPRE